MFIFSINQNFIVFILLKIIIGVLLLVVVVLLVAVVVIIIYIVKMRKLCCRSNKVPKHPQVEQEEMSGTQTEMSGANLPP